MKSSQDENSELAEHINKYASISAGQKPRQFSPMPNVKSPTMPLMPLSLVPAATFSPAVTPQMGYSSIVTGGLAAYEM